MAVRHLVVILLSTTPFVSAMAQDTDMDGDIDSADRTVMTTNWTGALRPGDGQKTSADGDTDADGDVDTFDLIAWFDGTGAFDCSGTGAQLVYDRLSGRVTLDATNASAVSLSALPFEARKRDWISSYVADKEWCVVRFAESKTTALSVDAVLNDRNSTI